MLLPHLEGRSSVDEIGCYQQHQAGGGRGGLQAYPPTDFLSCESPAVAARCSQRPSAVREFCVENGPSRSRARAAPSIQRVADASHAAPAARPPTATVPQPRSRRPLHNRAAPRTRPLVRTANRLRSSRFHRTAVTGASIESARFACSSSRTRAPILPALSASGWNAPDPRGTGGPACSGGARR